MRKRVTLFVAVCGAGLGWAALALQLALTLSLIVQGGTALDGIWRYLGYFTVIANLFAALVLSLGIFSARSPRLEFSAVTAMILVGVVYHLLLRQTWDPQGWQKAADVALHAVMPLIVTAFSCCMRLSDRATVVCSMFAIVFSGINWLLGPLT